MAVEGETGQVAPGVVSSGTENAAPAAPAEGSAAERGGAAADTPGAGGAQGLPSVPAQEPAPAPDWKEKRIGVLTAQLKEARQRLATAPPAAAEEAPAAVPSGSGPDAVEARARELVARERFAEQCKTLVNDGKKKYGAEWDTRLADLVQVVDQQDPRSLQAYSDLVANALRVGNAPDLLHALGGDLSRAQDLLAMTPVEQAVELAKMSSQRQPQMESSAPPPIVPVGGGGPAAPIDPTDAASDKLSTREWMKRREEQIAKTRPRGRAA